MRLNNDLELRLFACYTNKNPSSNQYKFKGYYKPQKDSKNLEIVERKIVIRAGAGFLDKKLYISLESNKNFTFCLSYYFKGYLKHKKLRSQKNKILRTGSEGFFEEIDKKLFHNMNIEEKNREINRIKKKRRRHLRSISHGKNFILKNIISNIRENEIKKTKKLKETVQIVKKKAQQAVIKKNNILNIRKDKIKFYLERSDIWRVMKKILTNSLLEKEKVITFYKNWIVFITFFDILGYIIKWKKLQKAREKNIKKVIKNSNLDASFNGSYG